MHVGLALPQFDPADRGDETVPWSTVRDCAQRAEGLGFESLWLTDQGFDPLVALGALARITRRVRLAPMLDAGRRPASVVAKALATIDIVSRGRLIVGLGADSHRSGRVSEGPDAAKPDQNGGGAEWHSHDETVELAEACQVLVGMFGGGPFSFTGTRAQVSEARCLPLPVQRPHPPIWVCGDGDGLLDVVARHADGWSSSWARTPEAYGHRLDVLDAACARVGRDPATVTRAVGLSILVGEDDADLVRRFRHLGDADAITAGTLDEWRQGRLVGTVEEVGHQLEEWETLGVDTVILGVGSLPFSAMEPDDMAMLASACSLEAL